MTRSPAARVPLFLSLPYFDVTCDLLPEQTNGNIQTIYEIAYVRDNLFPFTL